MGSRDRLVKDADYETRFRCAGGTAILREEVWVDADGKVVRYNLAFLLPHVFHRDQGRVLGYDNAHGTHERHFLGKVAPCIFTDCASTADGFFCEVEGLRRNYEIENF